MNLPDISIPFNLPVDVPVLLHPAIVHFAVVLPIIVLIIELINLFVKKRTLSALSVIFLMMIVVVFVGAYFTGKADGKNAFEFMSSDAKSLLGEHKLIGIYLVYFSAILLLIKLLSMTFRKVIVKILFLLLLLGFIGATLYQGKEGGELVYEHGSNVKALGILSEKVSELKEEITEMGDDEDEEEDADKAASEEKSQDDEAKESDSADEKATTKENSAEESVKKEDKQEELKAAEATEESPSDVKEEKKSSTEESKNADQEAVEKEQPKETEEKTTDESVKNKDAKVGEDSATNETKEDKSQSEKKEDSAKEATDEPKDKAKAETKEEESEAKSETNDSAKGIKGVIIEKLEEAGILEIKK